MFSALVSSSLFSALVTHLSHLTPSFSMAAERMREVFEQITPMLCANGNSHQRIGNARRRQLFLAQFAMRRGARMADECFDPAEADGIAADLQAAEEVKCRQSATVELE